MINFIVGFSTTYTVMSLLLGAGLSSFAAAFVALIFSIVIQRALATSAAG
jgi:hypothetical protein